MVWIQLAHHFQLGVSGRFRFDQLISDAKRPSRIRENFFDADARMYGREKRFAIVAEAQDAERGNHGGRSRRRGQTVRAPPVTPSAKTWRSDMANAVRKASAIVDE